MVLKYQISKAPARLENMEVKIYEAESPNPGSEVYTEVIPEKDAMGVPTPGAGHQVINTITANGLDSVVHIVRLYGVTSGELIHEYNAEPKVDVVTVFDPIQFKIGDGGPYTPAADSNSYTNPILENLVAADYLIHRNNYGFLFDQVHYEVTDSATGTWGLLTTDVFGDGEEFTIQMKPKAVSTVVNDSVVGKWFKGFLDVSANTSYSNTHLRKLVRFSGSPEYTFLITDNVPIGYMFAFQHYGSAGTAKVKFQNGTLLWAGSPKASIDIPRYSEGGFVWDGTNWNVVYLCDSTWANAASVTYPVNSIVASGNFSIGDVGAGDPQWEITHSKNIPGDYNVLLSIKSNNAATYFRNNKMGSTWWHHATDKPNKFWVSLQEISGEVQDLSITWVIVKL